MAQASKPARILLNFSFDGQIKNYLTVLPFQEARIVFMFRARMFPTKVNFPNRWTSSSLCAYCCSLDTDEHVFQCCGYQDLCESSVTCEMFYTLDCSIEDLSVGANVLLKIYERMNEMQEDTDINCDGSGSSDD